MYTGDCIKCQPEVSGCAHSRAGTNMGAMFLHIIRTELNSSLRPG